MIIKTLMTTRMHISTTKMRDSVMSCCKNKRRVFKNNKKQNEEVEA